jgi:hypothetical protein
VQITSAVACCERLHKASLRVSVRSPSRGTPSAARGAVDVDGGAITQLGGIREAPAETGPRRRSRGGQLATRDVARVGAHVEHEVPRPAVGNYDILHLRWLPSLRDQTQPQAGI